MGAGRVKRTVKGAEPHTLQAFRQVQPHALWDALRHDAHHGGMQAYADIRHQTHQDQGGLCAYCEIDISPNDPLKSRIEHFHPKSDRSTPTNWALAWHNMLAVCAGGSYRHAAAPHTLEPLDENLSCDAHKDRLIQKKQLPQACEGWLLNPLQLPAWPSLFEVNKSNGELRPSHAPCSQSDPWPHNPFADLNTLVAHTIAALNLNCPRLCAARLVVVRDIERNKKKQRLAGHSPQQGLAMLAQRYLHTPWPGFFTTICHCLGSAADDYLHQAGYQG